MHLSSDIQQNGIGKTLILGFSQVAREQKIRDYMLEGAKIANDIVVSMFSTLSKENINVPPTYDSDLLNSTTPPFSDKLMMFHVGQISWLSLNVYGEALGQVLRKDLVVKLYDNHCGGSSLR